MKGRANYLCLHRFDQFAGGGNQMRGRADRGGWACAAPRPAIGRSSRIFPEDSGLWRNLGHRGDLSGGECPQFQQCFVTRMRQRAAESDVVIVNHHLLCADAAVRQSSYGEVIPDCRHLILDEAHQLEEIATQYFGLSVSNYRLDNWCATVERLLNAASIRRRQDGEAGAVARVNRSRARVFRRRRHGAAGARATPRGAPAHRTRLVRRRRRSRPVRSSRPSTAWKRSWPSPAARPTRPRMAAKPTRTP